MKRSLFAFAVVATLPFWGAGCASRPAEIKKAPSIEATRVGWVRTELYFSLGDWIDTAFSTDAENKWLAFLDAEVTPRFPDGLSVVDVYGQWRDTAKPDAAVRRERSRLLVIVHRDEAAVSAKIDEVRHAWKTRTGEKSVLRVSGPADVSF